MGGQADATTATQLGPIYCERNLAAQGEAAREGAHIPLGCRGQIGEPTSPHPSIDHPSRRMPHRFRRVVGCRVSSLGAPAPSHRIMEKKIGKLEGQPGRRESER